MGGIPIKFLKRELKGVFIMDMELVKILKSGEIKDKQQAEVLRNLLNGIFGTEPQVIID